MTINPEDIKIIPYDPAFKQAFHDLNIAWLEAYFTVEPIHRRALENPEKEIIKGGGEIFFAIHKGRAIGTVGVRRERDGVYELTKLGVDPNTQGLGLGRKLCEAVIGFFKSQQGQVLFLETHNKLKPALHIYEQLNFVEMKNPAAGHYEGCDIYMEWKP